MMPRMDGYTLLKTLLARGDLTPAVVLTGLGSIREAMAIVHDLRAFWFLEKPAQKAVLAPLLKIEFAPDVPLDLAGGGARQRVRRPARVRRADPDPGGHDADGLTAVRAVLWPKSKDSRRPAGIMQSIVA